MYFNNFYKLIAYSADSFMVLFILLNKGIDQKSMFISNVNKPFKITELLCRPLVKLIQQLAVTLYILTALILKHCRQKDSIRCISPDLAKSLCNLNSLPIVHSEFQQRALEHFLSPNTLLVCRSRRCKLNSDWCWLVLQHCELRRQTKIIKVSGRKVK